MADKSSVPAAVPYYVHEGEMMRAERQIKRLWVALIVAIAMDIYTRRKGW